MDCEHHSASSGVGVGGGRGRNPFTSGASKAGKCFLVTGPLVPVRNLLARLPGDCEVPNGTPPIHKPEGDTGFPWICTEDLHVGSLLLLHPKGSHGVEEGGRWSRQKVLMGAPALFHLH